MAATDFSNFYTDFNIFFVSQASHLRILIQMIEYAFLWIGNVFISVYTGYYPLKQNGGHFSIWPPLVSACGFRDVYTISHLHSNDVSDGKLI